MTSTGKYVWVSHPSTAATTCRAQTEHCYLVPGTDCCTAKVGCTAGPFYTAPVHLAVTTAELCKAVQPSHAHTSPALRDRSVILPVTATVPGTEYWYDTAGQHCRCMALRVDPFVRSI